MEKKHLRIASKYAPARIEVVGWTTVCGASILFPVKMSPLDNFLRGLQS
jgi:hypothetical protein